MPDNQFALDRVKARQFLSEYKLGPDWDPAGDHSDAPDISGMLAAASDGKVITGPAGASLFIEAGDDEEGYGYRWFVRADGLLLAGPYAGIENVGMPGAKGDDAALAILEEAVAAGNAELGKLAAAIRKHGGQA